MTSKKKAANRIDDCSPRFMGTFLFVFASALLAPIVCYGNEGSKTAEGATEQFPCNFDASRAILEPDVYKNYMFKKNQNDQATESALISKDLQLEIQSTGCVDSFFQKFTFSIPSIPGEKHDIKYWSSFVREKLSALKLNKDSSGAAKGLIEFLAKVPSYQLREGKISICRDGSVSDQDGCSWNTGGGYSFEVKETRRRISIVVSQDQSM